jgi:hypothetical protein
MGHVAKVLDVWHKTVSNLAPHLSHIHAMANRELIQIDKELEKVLEELAKQEKAEEEAKAKEEAEKKAQAEADAKAKVEVVSRPMPATPLPTGPDADPSHPEHAHG